MSPTLYILLSGSLKIYSTEKQRPRQAKHAGGRGGGLAAASPLPPAGLLESPRGLLPRGLLGMPRGLLESLGERLGLRSKDPLAGSDLLAGHAQLPGQIGAALGHRGSVQRSIQRRRSTEERMEDRLMGNQSGEAGHELPASLPGLARMKPLPKTGQVRAPILPWPSLRAPILPWPSFRGLLRASLPTVGTLGLFPQHGSGMKEMSRFRIMERPGAFPHSPPLPQPSSSTALLFHSPPLPQPSSSTADDVSLSPQVR